MSDVPNSTGASPPPELPEWVGGFGNQPEPLFELYCADLQVAATFAARHDWWRGCWVWRTDVDAPAVPAFRLLREPDLDVEDRPDVEVPAAIAALRAVPGDSPH